MNPLSERQSMLHRFKRCKNLNKNTLLFLMSRDNQNESVCGTHLMMKGIILSDEFLSSLPYARPLLERIIRELHLSIVSQTSHSFLPHGYSCSYLFTDGHMNIHTYPEEHIIYITIFLIGDYVNENHIVHIICQIANIQNMTRRMIRQ
jgi:S-adenosylmethionine/arginine decarboxylase-like enzyme